MKINCVYFDDEMGLTQEIKLTKDQLLNFGIELDNLAYGFVIRNRNVGSLPENWDHIMEYLFCDNVIWKDFIFDGKLFLVGISYEGCQKDDSCVEGESAENLIDNAD